jgi:hypothetical protein
MMGGWHSDRGGIGRQLGKQEMLDGRIYRDLVLSRHGGGTRRIWLNHSNKLYGSTGGPQLSPDAKMVAAKGTGTDDDNP